MKAVWEARGKTNPMKTVMTLIMIYNDDQILLAMKKRGFGAGRWNGYGGKVAEGESIEDSAKRELVEESGITAQELLNRGQLTFTFEDSDTELEVHLFSVNRFVGEPSETEEMKPQWFAHSEIPYPEMWADDPHWLPLVLSGKNVKGSFHFNNSKDQQILNKTVETYE